MIPSARNPAPPAPAIELASRHALAWMVLGNAVGLWMAASLQWPRLGDALSPLGYGRWAPVHLNAHLYGWCALPLVALLLQAYFPRSTDSAWPRSTITAWSAALAFGCVSWLSGVTSGKLFMEWKGLSLLLFCLALAWLALVLAQGLRSQWQSLGRWAKTWRCALLIGLAPVPVAMALAASPRVYPTINPHSGGATGSSLLGSTLVLIAIFLATPSLLGVKRTRPATSRQTGLFVLLGVHFLAYAFVESGDSSHHDWVQVVGLFSLWIWPPLLWVHYRGLQWPPGAFRWLGAFAAWGVFLTVTACLMFLPGGLERTKFTHAFVGHTHAAMAGMLTSYLMLVLLCLNAGRTTALGAGREFLLWQFGCVSQVAVLMVLGALEALGQGELYGPSLRFEALFMLRLLSGLPMLLASLGWWYRFQPSRNAMSNPENFS